MKIRKRLVGIIIAQLVLSIFLIKSYALDPLTHRTLNKYIANNSVAEFSLDTYFREQLELQI
ncbi:MAG: hypothetical protein JRL30_23175 [Deltaproteobacteria bacterium]|nr:hypothetical protein [Deltaproteobacteria bacterium]